MSKIKPSVDTTAAPKKRAWGPLYVIVRDSDGARQECCIYSDHEPNSREVQATAEKAVRDWTAGYRQPYHWEPYHETPMEPGTPRGGSALAEAKRRILDDPYDSKGKTFLQNLKGRRMTEAVGARLAIPREVKRQAVAQQIRELDETPLITGQGPIAFDPEDPEFKTKRGEQ